MTPLRIRGDGPPVVWPADMAPRIEAVAAIRDRLDAEGDSRAVMAELDAAMRAAARAFAAAQGWTYTRQHPRPSHILRTGNAAARRTFDRWAWPASFRHPYWFLASARGPVVAVVIHVYSELDLIAIPEGIAVDRLPASWYFPNRTIAYVLHRRPAQTPDDDKPARPHLPLQGASVAAPAAPGTAQRRKLTGCTSQDSG